MDNMIKNAEFKWVVDNILRNFDHIKMDHIVKLGEGWKSRAYLINQKTVFRFPKEKDGAIDTEKEIKVLPVLKKQISLNIPEFIFCGQLDNGYPFVGYNILPGEPMNEQLFHSLSTEIKGKIADQIAGFIDQISSFNIEQVKDINIAGNNFYQEYSKRFKQVKEKGFPHIDKKMQTYISFRFESYLANKDHFIYLPKLLHADLSLDHLLFDPKRQELSGIIDFGDMKMGDPDYEYLYLLEECGEAFTIEVMERRKENNIPYKLEKLLFFLTADNVLLLLEGLKRNNREMVEEAIKIILYEMKGHKLDQQE